MKTGKRILSLLLSLMLVLGTVAVGGVSVSAAGNPSLKVGDVVIDVDNTGSYYDGKVVYDPLTKTLTLDDLDLTLDDIIDVSNLDLTITGSAILTSTSSNGYPIFANNCNLKLNGNFILRAQTVSGGALSVDGNLTIEGGFLDVINTANNNAISLYRDGAMTVDGGSVYAKTNDDNAIYAGGDLTVNGGSLYAKTESNNDKAIYADEITLNNDECYALGDKNAKEVIIKKPGTYIRGEKIEYGTYPQSKVTDETTLAALNALAPENFDDWTSYGYYYSDSGEFYDGGMKPGDFMRYYDAVLDGVKYRAVLFSDYRPYATDSACSADNSYQDENGYNTDTVYWFKYEPVEWRVLDPDDGLILCESAIDSQAFNNYIIENGTDGYGYTAYWGDSAQTYYANNYAESSIRKWLNDDFINTAFSASQQDNIKETELNNDAYSESNSLFNSAQTNDKVFLLSYAEATNSAYGFDAEASNEDTARRTQGSDYAKCQGLYVYSDSGSEYEGNSFWRLRSPGDNSRYSCRVYIVGIVYNYCSTYYTDYGVRPALKLQNLKPDPTGVPVTIDPGMELTISPEQPVWGDDITITATLPENATGTVTFRLDEADTGETVTVENGKAVYAIEGKSIEVGDHTVLASYSGDERYNSVSAELPLRVSKAETEVHITVEPENPLSGQDISITATVDGDAKIVDFKEHGLDDFNLGGATLIVDESPIESLASETNTVTFNIPGLDAGEHNIEVIYNGDEHYKSTSAEKTINVGKANPEITVTAGDITYGETEEMVIISNAEGTVTVTIEETGEEFEANLEGGETTVSISGLKPGNYNYTVHFDETDDFDEKDVTGTFTVNSVDCALTINYVYADGTQAAETYTDSVEIFKDYSVTSPAIEGYTPDPATVEGTMGDEDMNGKTVTVTYTADEYTATFVDENGETVETVTFTVETESITEPAVPEKAGYAGEWEEYTLGTSNITIKPVYANITSIQLENYEENSETGYKEDKTFTVKADDLPEGAEIHWFVNGEDVGTGESYTVEDPTDDYNIYAEVIDKDGNTLDTTKVQSVKVRNGFFDRLKAFFAELIEKILGKAIADLLSSVC